MKHSFFVKGEALHRRGETGSTLYYVISGYLEVIITNQRFKIYLTCIVGHFRL